MIRLVASDVDGTLLRGDETAIHPDILHEIARLREKGILFCPASGRQYDSLKRLFGPMAGELYYLCGNGAMIYGPGDPGPVLHQSVMDRESSLSLCRDILCVPEFELVVFGVHSHFLFPKCADIVQRVHHFIGDNIVLLRDPADIGEDILKVSIYCRHGGRYAAEHMPEHWKNTFLMAIAGDNWLDYTAADKGTALNRLCGLLGIGSDEVMAFGDNYNDVTMLESAARPYIMDTSARELRSRFPQCGRVEDILSQL